MSTSLEMPSSGLVVVENSGTAEHGHLIQSQTQLHPPNQQQPIHIHHNPHHHQQPQPVAVVQQSGQKVVINEEYINAETLVASSGGHYISTTDLIGNGQILKFVSEEEALLFEHQQQIRHHDEQPHQIYVTQQEQPPQFQQIPVNTPKVHLNNMVMSKNQSQINNQQQIQHQNTISFVQNKPTPNFTYLTTSQAQIKGPMVNKMVNGTTYKTIGATVGIHQQQQHQQQQLNYSTPMTQKFTQKMVARGIAAGRANTVMATNITTQQPQQIIVAQTQQQQRNAVQTMVTHQPTGGVIQQQLHVQTKQAMSKVVRTNKATNHVGGGSSIKMMQYPVNSTNLGKSVKTIAAHHMAPTKMTAKTKKQFAAAAAASANVQSGSNLIYTSGPPIGTNNQVQKGGIHVQQIVANNHMAKAAQRNPATVPTVPNNIYFQSGNIPRPGKTTKYLIHQQTQHMQQSPHMQQQQPQPKIVFQTSPMQQPHQQHQPSAHTTQVKFTTAPHNQYHMAMQPQSTMQLTTGGSGGGTIKYVNAQGNVIASPNRIRAILSTSQPQQPQSMGPTTTYTYTTTPSVPSSSGATDLMSPSSAEPMASPSSVYSNANDELLSDEMSARILTSFKLSKPAAFNNNSLNHNNNTMNRSQQQPQHHTVVLNPPQPQQAQFVKQSPFGGSQSGSLPHQQQQQQQQPQQQIVYITNNEYGQPMVSNHQPQQQSQVQYLHRPVSSATTPTAAPATDVVDSVPNASHFFPQFGNVKNDSAPFINSSTTIVAANNSESSAPQFQRLPQLLQSPFKHQQQQPASEETHLNQSDSEIACEEVRPGLPINSVYESRLRAVFAILHDHTYAIPNQTNVSSSSTAAATASSAGTNLQPQQLRSVAGQTIAIATTPQNEIAAQAPTLYQHLGGTGIPTTSSGMTPSHIYNSATIAQPTVVGGPVQKAVPAGTGFNFVYNKHIDKDDDTHSVISNGMTAANRDAEFGDEETDTAPEGEGEDDSVTRCICDFTHDDGYMICCDKCSAWQHVDCMGIDRQNIPDEYHCESCKPRTVDRIRARALQLLKRKEQQTFLLLNNPNGLTPQELAASTPLPIDGLPAHIALVGPQPSVPDLPALVSTPTTKQGKSKSSTSKARKTSNSEGTSSASKRKRTDSGSRPSNGKRRDTKKVSNAKRRPAKQTNTPNTSGSATVDLRQWIENYETAVTNHYSPELRARLQAIGKQQQQHHMGHPHLKNVHHLENGKCTIVPHAGGKILISTLDLTPSYPVIEIQGKYMLSGQYKQQQNVSGQVGRSPGPFLFFYRLPNDGPEICVDTRTYGNEARFVRRSCRPNAEILHTIEKGTIHLYIVSLSLIKSSTEITIRHEPHDLFGIREATLTAPTSTICACGLTKDCVFSSITPPVPTLQTPEPPVIAQTPLSPPAITLTPSKPVRPNGNLIIGDDSGLAATPVPPPPPTLNKPNYKRSKPAQNRNRSTSSSGESNTGMLSPSHQISYTHGSVSVTAAHIQMVHEPSGLYMQSASSSPPVSLASPSLPSPIAGQAILNQITYQQVQTQAYPSLPMEIVPHSPHHSYNHLQTTPVIHPITKQMVDLPPATIHLVPALPKPTPPSSPAPSTFTTSGFASPPSATSVIQISVCTTMTTSTASIPSPILPPATLSLVPTTPTENHPMPLISVIDHQAVIVPSLMTLRPTSLLLDELTTTETLAESPRSQHDEGPLTPLAKPMSPMKSPSASKTLPTVNKKSPRKTSFSFSEDSSSMAGDEITMRKDTKEGPPTTPTPSAKKLTSEESKKLTREERKMQAIVKAFEKMEKNQLRKQELKQNKGSSSGNTPTNPSTPIPTSLSNRPNLTSPNSKSHNDSMVGDENATGFNHLANLAAEPTSSPSKRSTSQSQRKKKRKVTKSYQQIANHKKRVRKRLHSGDSDGRTSEDSTSMCSPNNQSNVFHQIRSTAIQNICEKISKKANDSDAAGMLMSLASHCTALDGGDDNGSPMKSTLSSIRRSLSEQTTPPSFPLSSACMLVEAAVGPFERTHTLDSREFKMPAKTKTKKTIMNEWLHQSVGEETNRTLYATSVQYDEQPPPQQATYSITSSPMDDYPSTMITSQHSISDEPQNLSMVTQRINEFISSAIQESNQPDPQWSPLSNVYIQPAPVMTIPPAFPTPPMQCGSSVKKRWLRQAISEECSDDLSTPPNGYMTPLKKRRMARECSAAAVAAAETDSFPVTEQAVLRYDQYQDIAPADVIPMQSYQHRDNLLVTETPNHHDHQFQPELKIEMKAEDVKVEEKFGDAVLNNAIMANKAHGVYFMHKIEGTDTENHVLQEPVVEVKPKEEEDLKFESKMEQYNEETVKDEPAALEPESIETRNKQSEADVDVPIQMELKMEVEIGEEHLHVPEPMPSQSDPVLLKAEPDFILSRHDVSLPEPVTRVRPMLNEDEFDIKPLEECDVKDNHNWTSSEGSPKRESILPSEVNVTPIAVPPSGNVDEIADIQQRLSSFHSENLMILQSRNKKKHSRGTTPTMEDDCSGGASRSVSPERISASAPSSAECGTKKRKKGKHLNFDTEADEKSLEGIEPKPDDITYEYTSEPKYDPPALEVNHVDATPFSSFLLQPPPPPPPFPPPSVVKLCDPTILIPASIASLPPPPPPPIPHTVTVMSSPPSFFNKFPEIVSQLPAAAANKSLLSEYLENPNKSSSLSSLSFVSPIPAHSMFNVNTLSFSSLDGTPSTLAVDAIPTPPTISPSLLTATCPKIVTRTQCNDPRLNPSLAVPAPPPTPKRKLSINEYRKRKQQSSGPTETPVDGTTKSGSSLKQSGISRSAAVDYPSMLTMPKCMSLENTDSGSPKLNGSLSGSSSLVSPSPDDKITVFSPAPTLLELQQENLSLRLKNYKSLHGLTSQSSLIGNSNCDEKDKSDITGSSLECSSKLSCSSSSLTSISSSGSTTPDRSSSPIPPVALTFDHRILTTDSLSNGRHVADAPESSGAFSPSDKLIR